MKTSELQGAALDWAVAKADQPVYSDKALIAAVKGGSNGIGMEFEPFTPSTNWAQGGSIIEREGITVGPYFSRFFAARKGAIDNDWQIDEEGPTPLIAAMRCYVASKLGDEVVLPEELK